MSQPYEVVAQPFTLYVADPGSEFPSIDEEPGESWTKIGTSGDLNITEDGVKVTHSQKLEYFRSLGSTLPIKAFRVEEELKISLTIADISLEQYAIAMNGNSVTQTPAGAGTAGYKSLGFSRGLNVRQYAVLARGQKASAFMEDGVAQYELPVAIQAAEQEVGFTKGTPAGLALEFQALLNPNAEGEEDRFARLIMQDTEPGT